MRLNIKPLSVNAAWKGKRFKTNNYKRYEVEVLKLLSPFEVPNGELELRLKFGFSSASSDFDNPVKCFVDCLQKKYKFNDKMIKRCIIDVEQVNKGEEFIDWSLTENFKGDIND
jgi:Holliday junction resolvase RusA-like endonuclease